MGWNRSSYRGIYIYIAVPPACGHTHHLPLLNNLDTVSLPKQRLHVQMVDVGCGIGGSSRHIAKKFGCKAEGITLSPVQVLFAVRGFACCTMFDYRSGHHSENKPLLHCSYT